jgi:hypothetical protein
LALYRVIDGDIINLELNASVARSDPANSFRRTVSRSMDSCAKHQPVEMRDGESTIAV